MKIEFSSRKSFRFTLSIIGVMFVLHIFSMILQYGLGVPSKNFFVHLLNMEYENNIPSLWSGLLLLYASFLLFCVSRQMFKEEKSYKWLWTLLSLAFFYLCLDETFELHEKAMAPTHDLLNTGGIFYYSWVIPAGAALIIMGLVYLKFIFSLPARTRNLFILSGAIYVGTAIGFELIEGPIDQAGHWMNLQYAILVTFEETLEMFGICLFTYAVIDYADTRLPGKSLDIIL
ncbi:MAG: hypothetical protein WC071_01455 [Victivallaceae bacterium]